MKFHRGEIEIQERAGVRRAAEEIGEGIFADIAPGAAEFLARRQFAIVGTIEDSGAVWASVITGQPGFIEVVDQRSIRIAVPPSSDDPLFRNLARESHIALLAPDFLTARRLRVNGRGILRDGYIHLATDEVYGNCRRYIQERLVLGPRPDVPSEEPAARTSLLSAAQQLQISHADTFFIATDNPEQGADVSHRGGNPGFVQVIDYRHIAFPDYDGNNMFNTLGNIAVNPRAGLLFIDFDGGCTIQLAGSVSIDWDPKRARELAGAERVIDYQVAEIIDHPFGFPLLSKFRQFSRYNP
jgi:predicted pyridoxine 5'-phosphate oxidase superfamily flavin-nucleotide-binding protein